MTLSARACRRAVDFIEREARPLDRALLAWEARVAEPEAVLRALDAFQNDDGGYGHALEPDLRLPDSSVVATTTGLAFLREIGAPASEPRVRRALGWLARTFDPDLDGWRMVPPAVDDHPHAGHWDWALHESGGWREEHVNPGSLVLAFYWTWPELAPRGEAERLAALLPERFAACTPGPDALLAVQTLIATPGCPETLRKALRELVRERALAIVDRDPAHWSGYVPNPLKLAPSPGAPLGPVLREEAQVNLDWLLEHQDADGGWTPNWTWRGRYPDAWPEARAEWRGVLTRENLAKLRAWGRLEY